MEGLGEALLAAWLVSEVAVFVLSLVYLSWWGFYRDGERAQARSANARVRFEAIWGMILALPLPLLVLGAVSFPGTDAWLVAIAVAACVGFYAIPVLALLGRRLHAWARAVPAIVAIGTAPLVTLAVAIGYEFNPLAILVALLLAFGCGINYAAACIVSVRFARAVAARDGERLESATRSSRVEASAS